MEMLPDDKMERTPAEDFVKLKELILYRLDESDKSLKALSDKIDRRWDTLSGKLDDLRVEVQEKHNQHAVEIALLRIKSAGISAISGIIGGIIAAIVTAIEYIKRFKP